MTTRQELLLRPDVPDEDIDDIIGIAAGLHEAQRARERGRVSVQEVEAIASELDIGAHHVEAAIAQLRTQRTQEAEKARAAAKESLRRRRTALRVLALSAGIVVMVAFFGVAVGMQGADDLVALEREAASAETRLVAALERQAALAPQIAGLAGADAGALMPLQQAVADAPTLDARLAAASELNAAMARALGGLPPARSDAEVTLRVQLTDELTGSANRVSVEQRRYEEARDAWFDDARDGAGAWAIRLGMADSPGA